MKQEVLSNSAEHGPICLKLHSCDHSPALTTSLWLYTLTVIAPPSGSRKYALFYTLMSCSQQLDQINFKFGHIRLNTLMMIPTENGDLSPKGAPVAAWRIAISRHENWIIYISAAQGPIWTKLHVNDNSQGLNTSTLINFEILIAPHIGKLQKIVITFRRTISQFFVISF